MATTKTADARERFRKKVQEADSGCWEWTGHRFPAGYGQFWLNGRDVYAHRAAYELFVGPIPARALICHHCDNRCCVNPAHLYAGDVRSNARDAVARGRLRGRFSGNPARGEAHYAAKLDADAVRRLRSERERGKSYARLGSEFGVSTGVARRIATRASWKHVE
jgi:hypothetical protein